MNDAEDAADEDARSPRSLVDRMLAVLDTFRGTTDEPGHVRQRLTEISARSGLPMATTHRIARGLVAWGALEEDHDGRYHVGLRLWEIASLAPRSTDLLRIARPHMHDLFETTHHFVQLAVREGTEAVSVERFEDPRHERIRPRVGGRYPLHATAVGQVLLAHAPESVRDDVLDGPLSRRSARTPTTRAMLASILERIRTDGYAVSDREVDETHLGVSAPVRAPDGSVVAALSLTTDNGGSASASTVRTAVHLVRVATEAISRDLREGL